MVENETGSGFMLSEGGGSAGGGGMVASPVRERAGEHASEREGRSECPVAMSPLAALNRGSFRSRDTGPNSVTDLVTLRVSRDGVRGCSCGDDRVEKGPGSPVDGRKRQAECESDLARDPGLRDWARRVCLEVWNGRARGPERVQNS